MQDYIKESDNLVLLHDQIRDCDNILSQMETLLGGFQVFKYQKFPFIFVMIEDLMEGNMYMYFQYMSVSAKLFMAAPVYLL